MGWESRKRRRTWIRPVGDRQGVGGFYEAVMAMMIVTAGLVLLTCSFTFLAIGDADGADLRPTCEGMMSSILDNRTMSPSERLLDQRELGCADWASIKGKWSGGMAVFLTLPDGTSRMLYREDMQDGVERSAVSEPVNIMENGGKVSAAVLTVWVWP